MKTILVVDDQAMLRELMVAVLAGEDRRILQAENGDEAIEVAHRENPDLVLLDLLMPGGRDGLEVARALKADEKTRETIIIAVTARTLEVDRVSAREAGIVGYLTKPFGLGALMEEVGRYLD